MGSSLVCAKTKPKTNINITNTDYETFCKNLDNYLKNTRHKELITNIDSEHNKVYNTKNNFEKNSNIEINYDKENLVGQSNKNSNEENQKFEKYLQTNELTLSNLKEVFNKNNLLKISLELLSANQQAKIKNINHTNLFNSVTFPRILNDANNKDSIPVIETTDFSEKTNFRIVYNKNMQDLMNNLFFPDEFKMPHRNTVSFTANSISFRDLPVPTSQLNITTSNIGPHIMEISNLYNMNFNTQPNQTNDDLILKRRASNFTNFNKKIKNYYI